MAAALRQRGQRCCCWHCCAHLSMAQMALMRESLTLRQVLCLEHLARCALTRHEWRQPPECSASAPGCGPALAVCQADLVHCCCCWQCCQAAWTTGLLVRAFCRPQSSLRIVWQAQVSDLHLMHWR